MSKALPMFKMQNEMYRADTCVPLVHAVERGAVGIESLSHSHYPGRQIPPKILSGVSTVGYWDAVHDQEWGLPWHRNEGVEFTFLQSGSLGFAVDDHECTLQP